jgi:hypothetical protein
LAKTPGRDLFVPHLNPAVSFSEYHQGTGGRKALYRGAKVGIKKSRCAHSDRFEVIASADVGYPRALAGLCDNFIPAFKRVAEKTHPARDFWIDKLSQVHACASL